MSSQTTTTTSAGPIAPTSTADPIAPFYPLTQNNLQDIVKYHTTPYNQTGLTSLIARPRGSHLYYITAYAPIQLKSWSTVQTGKTTHIELNSALVYLNHSCAPTVEIHCSEPSSDGGPAGEVRVAHDRDLCVGDELTFFYPSTEWDCTAPFGCMCGAGDRCIGEAVRGSRWLTGEQLKGYYVNRHVEESLAERERLGDEVVAVAGGGVGA